MAKQQKIEQEEPLKKKLWKLADKLRKNMDAAEYKHVVLGLIFLKYISDAFLELHDKLKEGKGEYEGADPEDKNEYLAEKVFYVPPASRWNWLQGRATLPTIGKDIDDAMDAIEKDNPSLRGVLPKVYAQEKLDKTSLGGLVNLVGTATLGTKEAQSKDLLGEVFELAPTGQAGFVLSKGALTTNTTGEGEIRKALIENGLVDCIVNLPTKLFLNTQIPACLWFLSRNKTNGGFRKREDEILFIDARNLGFLVNRKNRDLSDADIELIAGTYHNWRNPDGDYQDVPGFCKVATLEEVRKLNHVLTPGRYVGLADEEDDFDFVERFTALKMELEGQMAEEEVLNRRIRENLGKIKMV